MSGSLSLGALLALPARFLAWWFGELAGCLPGFWRGRRNRLIATLAGDEILFERQQRSEREGLGRIDLAREADVPVALRRALKRAKAGEISLMLPEARVLQRPISLPLATAENLREVLAFEMDRHTPFSAQDVVFDFRITGRDDELDRLHVALFLIPRRSLEPILARLTDLGLVVTHCGLEGEPQLNFLGQASKTTHSPWFRRFSWVTVALCLFVLAAAAWLPLQARKAQLNALEQRLAEVRQTAFAADDLKSQVALRLDKSLFLVERKQETLAVIALLDEVTRRLPDGSWLIQFGLRGDRLTLAGYAEKPTELIGLLESSDQIGEVAFISPVVVDPRVQKERFNLQAQVRREASE